MVREQCRRAIAVFPSLPSRCCAFRIRKALHFDEGCKLVLRHAANRTLPDEWATRKKVGFPVPVKFWLREQKYYDFVKGYFTADWAAEFFDTEKLMKLLDDHFAGAAANQRKIYTALTFLIWYERFFIKEQAAA